MSFIDSIAPQAQDVMKQTGIPASFIIAQAILESASGTSTPHDAFTGTDSYNLFGIKGSGSNGSVQSTTTEYVSGKPVSVLSNFRAYKSYQDSMLDHANLIAQSYPQVIGKDGISAAYAVQSGSTKYATDPQYSQKLASIIQTNGLTKYDSGVPTPQGGLTNTGFSLGGALTGGLSDKVGKAFDWLVNSAVSILLFVFGAVLLVITAKSMFLDDTKGGNAS